MVSSCIPFPLSGRKGEFIAQRIWGHHKEAIVSQCYSYIKKYDIDIYFIWKIKVQFNFKRKEKD